MIRNDYNASKIPMRLQNCHVSGKRSNLRSLYKIYFYIQVAISMRNNSLAAEGAIAHRQQRCLQNPNWVLGVPKWEMGSGNESTLRSFNICQVDFFLFEQLFYGKRLRWRMEYQPSD